MQLHRFIAKDAAHAVRQIRAELGPQAVVAQVRRVAAGGLANLWGGTTLEVLACVPEEDNSPAPTTSNEQPFAGGPITSGEPSSEKRNGVALLESMGLIRVHAERVWESSRVLSAGNEPQTLGDEIKLLRGTLSHFWREPNLAHSTEPQAEIFLGPPGAGSTTVLCKLLVQDVLAKGAKACVWRLDGAGPNLSERLMLQCELLGVPVLREWKQGTPPAQSDRAYVDIPGVSFRNATAVERIGTVLKGLGKPRVHLCLNAAYSTPLLIEQFRAFSGLPISDLVFTHLDEERSWGKLWNFVIGTHLPIWLLSAGQNVPGDLHVANPTQLLEAAFSR